jgi:hypothetical protein
MSRRVIWTAAILALCAAVAGVGSVLYSRVEWRNATENGRYRDFRDFTGKQLEQDVRSRVPLDSSREFVDGFLTGEEMTFSHDPKLNTIGANVQCKGSGIITESLGLIFRFDSDSKLKSIESHVYLTGP